LGFDIQTQLSVIHCDNTSTISNAYDPNRRDKTKHINVQYFLVSEKVQAGDKGVEFTQRHDAIAEQGAARSS
jgi:hypothetical protein